MASDPAPAEVDCVAAVGTVDEEDLLQLLLPPADSAAATASPGTSLAPPILLAIAERLARLSTRNLTVLVDQFPDALPRLRATLAPPPAAAAPDDATAAWENHRLLLLFDDRSRFLQATVEALLFDPDNERDPAVVAQSFAVAMDAVVALCSGVLMRPYEYVLQMSDAESLARVVYSFLRDSTTIRLLKEQDGVFQSRLLPVLMPVARNFSNISDTIPFAARSIVNYDFAASLEQQLRASQETPLTAQFRGADPAAAIQTATDSSAIISLRRSALKSVLQSLRSGSNPTDPRKAREAAAEIGAFVRASAASLLRGALSECLADVVGELIMSETNRSGNLKLKETPESVAWLIDVADALRERARAGDVAMFTSYIGAGVCPVGGSMLRPIGGDLLKDFGRIFLDCTSLGIPKKLVSDTRMLCQTFGVSMGASAVEELLEALERGDQSAEYTLTGTIKDNILEIQPLWPRILKTKKYMLVNLVLSQDGKLLVPLIEDILEMVASDDYSLSNAAGTALSNIADADTSRFTNLNMIKRVIDAYEPRGMAKSYSYVSYYGLKVLSTAFGPADRETKEYIADWLISKMRELLKISNQLSQTAIMMFYQPFTTVIASDQVEVKLRLKELVQDVVNDTTNATTAQIRMTFQNLLNELEGLTLASIKKALYSTMGAIGIDPDDPFFDAVKAAQEVKLDHYDVMLSY
ncbi:hypothetical protein HK405_003393, partial [Cladochytrium tenue]